MVCTHCRPPSNRCSPCAPTVAACGVCARASLGDVRAHRRRDAPWGWRHCGAARGMHRGAGGQTAGGGAWEEEGGVHRVAAGEEEA
jgi:hypothetical protein